jgi:hypothetical protein
LLTTTIVDHRSININTSGPRDVESTAGSESAAATVALARRGDERRRGPEKVVLNATRPGLAIPLAF